MFNIKEFLPLHLCSVALILVIFVSLIKNKWLFNILYFWGFGGALNALLFPDIFHNFPHFNLFSFLYLILL